MLQPKHFLRNTFLILGLAVVSVAGLHADIVPVYEATLSTPGSLTYDLDFNTGIDVTTNLPSEKIGGSTTVPSFVTIYDIIGFTGASINASDASLWSVSSQLVGVTPPGTAPTDNASIFNVTVTYTGPSSTSEFSDADALTITSTLRGVTVGRFTSQDLKNTGAVGTAVASIGSVAVPAASVPEVGTPALAGVGFLILGSLRFLKRKRT